MTTEQAEQSVQEAAEPLTQEQAQTEIERLHGDQDFLKIYLDRSAKPGVRKEMTNMMAKLIALAHPPEPPPELARPGDLGKEQQQPLSEGEQTEAEAEAETELNEAKQVMQNQFGREWEEEMSDVRDSIREIGGETLFEHLESNFGRDPVVMGQLMEMQRENQRYPLVAALAELVEQNMTPNRALLEMERRLADPEFVTRYTNSGARGHKESLAVMRALHIAADPPAFITGGARK